MHKQGILVAGASATSAQAIMGKARGIDPANALVVYLGVERLSHLFMVLVNVIVYGKIHVHVYMLVCQLFDATKIAIPNI